jgi:hypothetical protein
MTVIPNLGQHVGQFFGQIELELCRDNGISRPRARPVSNFSPDTRTEMSRHLREMFPIGTRFIATVKVCQKHNPGGQPFGKPYLKVYDLALIATSIPDEGLVAKVKSGSVSGLSYEYVQRTT